MKQKLKKWKTEIVYENLKHAVFSKICRRVKRLSSQSQIRGSNMSNVSAGSTDTAALLRIAHQVTYHIFLKHNFLYYNIHTSFIRHRFYLVLNATFQIFCNIFFQGMDIDSRFGSTVSLQTAPSSRRITGWNSTKKKLIMVSGKRFFKT